MRSKLVFPLVGSILLAGCGGGSGSSATDPGGSVPTGPANTFGPIETRGQVNGTPIVRDLSRISTVALAGVLTDATYRPQGIPDNETAILTSNASSIKFFMEDGEPVDTWHPALTDPTDFVLLPTFSPDGQKIYFFTTTAIYSMSIGDPTTITPVISAAGLAYFTLSPDGTKIAYTRQPPGEADTEVYVRGVAGGATKRLTTNDVGDTGYAWIDNDRVAVNSGGDTPGTNVVTVSTLASIHYTPFATNIAPIGRTRDGDYFFNNYPSDTAFGVSVTQRYIDSTYQSKDYLTSDISGAPVASISPDGTRWAVASFSTGLYTTELFPKTVHTVLDEGPSNFPGASWQPPLGITKFVGAGGKVGTTSAGIIATHRAGIGRNGLASFVSWDATTRTTSTVSDDATDSGAGNKSYTIEADKLTALRYANRPLFNAVATVSASGTANGAVVTIDAEDGLVRSIVVYQETRGAKPSVRREGANKVIEGHLLGVWNAKGQNVAPQGASRVTLDDKGAPMGG